MPRFFAPYTAFFLFFFLLSTSPSFSESSYSASEIEKKNPNIDKYEFAKAFIRSLGDVSSALDRFKEVEDQSNKTDIESTMDLMKVTKRSSSDYERAAAQIDDFSRSKNELIALMATSLLASYDSHIQLNDEMIKIYEEMYGPEAMSNPDKVDLGKLMRRQSDLTARHEEFMRFLMQTSLFMTQILVSEQPDSEGKMSILGITSQQKQDLIKDLEIIFGEKVKNGFKKAKGSLNYFDSCGAILYEVLALGNFKTTVVRARFR